MGTDEIFRIPTTTKPIKVVYNSMRDDIEELSKSVASLTISAKEAKAACEAMNKLIVSNTFSCGKFSEEGYLYQTFSDFNTIGKSPEEEEWWPFPF